jgi:hypothetical protein
MIANTPYHHLHPRELVKYVVEIVNAADPIDCIAENMASVLPLSWRK